MPLNCVGTLFEETAAQAGQPLCCTALRDKCLFDYGTGCQNRGNGREEGILMQQEDAMSVLDKFAAVEIKADVRISEQDKQFCEQQAACTAALGEAARSLMGKRQNEVPTSESLVQSGAAANGSTKRPFIGLTARMG